MKKTITLLAAVFGLFAGSQAQTTIYSQNFEGVTPPALPSGWSQVTSAVKGWQTGSSAITSWPSVGTPVSGIPTHTTYAFVDAWDDSSKSNTTNQLKMQSLDFTSYAHPYITLDYILYGVHRTGSTVSESANISVSIDGGTTWTKAGDLTPNSQWSSPTPIDLSMAGGKSNVIIAFNYSDGGTHLFGLGIDNIKVFEPLATDLQLYSVSPGAGTGVVPSPSTTVYSQNGNTATLNVVVFNNGLSTITSFTYNTQVNGGTVSSVSPTGVNIAPFNYATFSATVTMPSTAGNNTIKSWVVASGDLNHGNDSASNTIITIAKLPKKTLLIEEATGIWCGFCPRGKVYMDSIHKAYPNDVNIISVHNQYVAGGRYDPLEIPAYDSYLATIDPLGYPSIVVDRRIKDQPDNSFYYYDNQNYSFGYADISVPKPTIAGTTLTQSVTVTPSINLSGDYRLALVLTEDRVHHTKYSSTPAPDPDGQWNQEDYYSDAFTSSGGGSANLGVLKETGYDYNALPFLIPDTVMYYDYTARYISDVAGKSGSLPTSMTAGSTYNYSFTATLDPSWKTQNLKSVILLIHGTDASVLNSASTAVTTSVANVNSGIDGIHIYPNPANEYTNVLFNLTQSTTIQVQIIDMTGRIVYTNNGQQMNAGENKLTISTANFATGLYNIKILSEAGSITERLTIVK